MSRDPFLRFALIALCTVMAVALWLRFGWRGVAFAVIGVLAAAFLSVDFDRSPPPLGDELAARVRSQRPRTDGDGKPVDFDRFAS